MAPEPERYAIRIEERLEPCWSEWLCDLTVTAAKGDGTLLTGTLEDQAALHGLLARIRDLNLTLISITRLGRDE